MRRIIISALIATALVATAGPVWAHEHHHHHHHHKHHHHGSHSSSSSDNDSGDSGTAQSGDAGSTGSSDDLPVSPTDGTTDNKSDSKSKNKSDDSTPATTDDGSADSATNGADAKIPTGSQQSMQVETTGYSFGDNQGSNNATISAPVIHKTASGDGTYANPTTLAVPGHAGSSMQTPKGTRIYFQKYHFYGIVEDSGASPKTLRRFDIWTDGRGNSNAKSCMSDLTGTSTAILNPPAGESVTYTGPRSDSKGCHAT